MMADPSLIHEILHDIQLFNFTLTPLLNRRVDHPACQQNDPGKVHPDQQNNKRPNRLIPSDIMGKITNIKWKALRQ